MKVSAGILVFKWVDEVAMVLLVHPAGPIWGHMDVWSIPKGELDEAEDHLAAARREFLEELGSEMPEGELLDLGTARGTNKTNFIWAVEGDLDVSNVTSNHFTMEWPYKSGQFQSFPENDRAEWFTLEVAKTKLFENQAVFIDRLDQQLNQTSPQLSRE